MEKNKSNLLDRKTLKQAVGSVIYSIAGKVFHVLLSGGNPSLEGTARGYLQKAHEQVEISKESKGAIQELKQAGKGIIISVHKTGTFSDYFPLFAELGDEILKKTIFYTLSYSASMNKKEFPEYTFRQATLVTREDILNLKQHILEDTKKINNEGGYIFVIPTGIYTEENHPFQAIFQRLVSLSADDLPVLVNHIDHHGKKLHAGHTGFVEIAKSIITGKPGSIRISSQLSQAGDRKKDGKALSGIEMREKYNKLQTQ